MWKLKISSLFACFVLIHADGISSTDINDAAEPRGPVLDIYESASIRDNKVQVGQQFSLTCSLRGPGQVWWTKDNVNLMPFEELVPSSILRIDPAKVEDSGNYTCKAKTADQNSVEKTISVTVLEPPKIPDEEGARVKSGSPGTLMCNLQGHTLSGFTWEKIGEPNKTEFLERLTHVSHNTENNVTMTLNFEKVTHEDNGTYVCSAKHFSGNISSERILVVTDVPEVKIVSAKAIGGGKVYLNWTVNDHNDQIIKYLIEYQTTKGNWKSQLEEIDTGRSNFTISGLETGTTYRFRITATNSLGSKMPVIFQNWITLSDKEPEFIPSIKVAEKTNSSITIDISPPPADLKDYDFYYNITVTHEVNITRTSYSGPNARAFTIEPLEPGTNYNIRVAACNYYTQTCGAWSAWTSDACMESNSSGLHPAGINFVVVNTVLIYFAIKYLFT